MQNDTYILSLFEMKKIEYKGIKKKPWRIVILGSSLEQLYHWNYREK